MLSCLFIAALWSPDLLALLCVVFVFLLLSHMVLDKWVTQVWYLIVSIPDLAFPSTEALLCPATPSCNLPVIHSHIYAVVANDRCII